MPAPARRAAICMQGREIGRMFRHPPLQLVQLLLGGITRNVPHLAADLARRDGGPPREHALADEYKPSARAGEHQTKAVVLRDPVAAGARHRYPCPIRTARSGWGEPSAVLIGHITLLPPDKTLPALSSGPTHRTGIDHPATALPQGWASRHLSGARLLIPPHEYVQYPHTAQWYGGLQGVVASCRPQ